MKIFPVIICVFLSGCVAYPYPYSVAYPAAPDPNRAKALADQECAKSGKVAEMTQAKSCDGTNCSTTFECR